MPVCVHCNAPAPYVYTVYRSKDNVRLKVCDTCQQFADPLIEHPLVLLLIDLILLKPRVYRHLIFNRGSSPYRASRILLPGKDDTKAGVQGHGKNGKDSGESEHVEKLRVTKIIWPQILLLAAVTMCVEILALYSTMSSALHDGPQVYFPAQEGRLLILPQLSATGAQHLTSTAISAAFLKIWYPLWLLSQEEKLKTLEARPTCEEEGDGQSTERKMKLMGAKTSHPNQEDGRGAYFTLPMVSLTLFFSSLLPCLLHVCLYVWSVTAVAQTGQASPNRHSVLRNNIKVAVTAQLYSHVPATWATQWSETWHGLAGTLQKEGIDEMWVVVRLLAGMSSGFGLRVVLPGPPWMTSLAVLGGWLVKTGTQTGLHALVLV
ncbi:sterol homeostasis protein [Naganishia albida]|nr:sterol homeostasis protein [Naganishia albida]